MTRRVGREGGRRMHESVHISRDPAGPSPPSPSLGLSLPPSRRLYEPLLPADCCRRCSLTKFHRVVIARFYCARTEQNVAPRNWRYETEPRGRAGERGEWTKRSMKCASDRGGGGYLHLSPWCVNHPLFVQGSRYPHTG